MHDNPLAGPIKRKPDLMLLDIDTVIDIHASKPEWKIVSALGEITSKPSNSVLESTIKNKAYITMNAQHDRRYFPCLSFFGGASFRLTLCDRAGIVVSNAYNIHTDALQLVRILTALVLGDSFLMGYDPTMRRGPGGDIISIMVDGDEYRVVKKLFSSTSLRGRATRCWHVERDGEQFVIKDSWIHEGRTSSEIDILVEIAAIDCVPTFIKGEDLKYPRVATMDGNSTITDSTKLWRAGLDYTEARVHRRILMQPVGVAIYDFTSKKELMGALVDVVESTSFISHFYYKLTPKFIPAHKILCERYRLLHRDISKNNLLLWWDPKFKGNHRRGLVIDYDYAERLDKEGDFSIGSRTVSFNL